MPTMVREPPAGTRIDLPRFYTGDYQATFARLRATDPVHWQADTEMWIVTRHADIRAVAAGHLDVLQQLRRHQSGRTPSRGGLWDKEGQAGGSDRRWRLAELRREIGRRSSAGPEHRQPAVARPASTLAAAQNLRPLLHSRHPALAREPGARADLPGPG